MSKNVKLKLKTDKLKGLSFIFITYINNLAANVNIKIDININVIPEVFLFFL